MALRSKQEEPRRSSFVSMSCAPHAPNDFQGWGKVFFYIFEARGMKMSMEPSVCTRSKRAPTAADNANISTRSIP